MPHPAWEVAAFFFPFMCGPLALPLLLLAIVPGMSVVSAFYDLLPEIQRWRCRWCRGLHTGCPSLCF